MHKDLYHILLFPFYSFIHYVYTWLRYSFFPNLTLNAARLGSGYTIKRKKKKEYGLKHKHNIKKNKNKMKKNVHYSINHVNEVLKRIKILTHALKTRLNLELHFTLN